ncbi:MAG TPA: hypothetical protein VIN09_13420 [Chloroflexota bacterium]
MEQRWMQQGSQVGTRLLALAFPMMDRFLLVDLREQEGVDPAVAVLESRDLLLHVQQQLGEDLRHLFEKDPSLIFSRRRLFSYLDAKLTQLAVQGALTHLLRPPLDEHTPITFSRVYSPVQVFFESEEWRQLERSLGEAGGPGVVAGLARARERLLVDERAWLARLEREERRRLLTGEGYYVIRPTQSNN